MKPDGFQHFRDIVWEMASEMIKEALPREGFRNAFSKRREAL